MSDKIKIHDLKIPPKVKKIWQEIATSLAKTANVPVGLIMKVNPPKISVFLTSKTKGNPYKRGESANLDGLYCETVLCTGKQLLVPNALKSKKWKNNPDIKLGMISYLGVPLNWPDNARFGTLCVLDKKENSYSTDIKRLIKLFKELIEYHLEVIMLEENLEEGDFKKGSILDLVIGADKKGQRLREEIEILKSKIKKQGSKP